MKNLVLRRFGLTCAPLGAVARCGYRDVGAMWVDHTSCRVYKTLAEPRRCAGDAAELKLRADAAPCAYLPQRLFDAWIAVSPTLPLGPPRGRQPAFALAFWPNAAVRHRKPLAALSRMPIRGHQNPQALCRDV